MPFVDLFGSTKAMRDYYHAYHGGMYTVVAIEIRKIIRRIGYDSLVPLVCREDHDAIESHTAGGFSIVYDEICRSIPGDFVVSMNNQFGCGLDGNYVISDLISVNGAGRVTIRNEDIIFRNILEKNVIPSKYDLLGRNEAIIGIHNACVSGQLATSKEDLFSTLIGKRFIASINGEFLPDEIKRVHLPISQRSIERRLAASNEVYERIFVKKSLLSDHTLSLMATKPQLTNFFDKLSDCATSAGTNIPVLRRFVTTFRLDNDA
jgi:hypothetical protein